MPKDLNPVWVDDRAGVEAVAATAADAGSLALDTEADSLHSYFHKICLIQVTGDGVHFVIDPLALEPADLEPLLALIRDPTSPVLMHGADYDIRVLDRDYAATVGGLLDTQVMAQILGEPKTGLAALLDKELGVALDKRHQRADWGKRPLSRSQVAYAAADTAYLHALLGRLRTRLEALGRWEWAVEECRHLETVRHRPAEPDPLAFERVKGVRALRGDARDRAFSLFEWRDEQARRLDTPPFRVLGNASLVAIAVKPPGNPTELADTPGLGPRFVRRWGRQVLRVIARPKPAPQRERRRRMPDPPPAVTRRLKRLTKVRNEVAAELAVEPGLLCSKAALLELASYEPRCSTPEELAAAGLGGWRRQVLGARFIDALATG